MRQTLFALAALLSHWRRHPANLATLIIGLSVATALWSGVQALNAQARKSYDSAAAAFTGGEAQNLVAARGGLFPQTLFVRLRRAGVKVSPAIEGAARIGEKNIRLIGLEPLTLPAATTLAPLRESEEAKYILTGEGRSFAAPQTLRDLHLEAGARAKTERGYVLPPIHPLEEAPPGAIVVDIGVAQKALDRKERLSRLIVSSETPIDPAKLVEIAGDALRIVEPDEESDLSRLTDSFHLNLTAFGLLAFLVGFFIVNASFGLAFEQRLPTVRTLRALGVSARALSAALFCELVAFTVLAGGLGVIGGYFIAAALLPDVAASLEGLYGAQLSGTLALDWRWWLSGVAMAGAGALLAAGSGLLKTLRLPVLSVARPIAWREAHQRYLRRQAIFAALSLLGAALAFRVADGLVMGFMVIALTLLGAALFLPLALEALLRVGERLARRPLARWFFADGRQEIAGLSLALMALLLALATNIGVGGMVEGFRQTFVGWLDERLIAEIYYEAATPADAREIEEWLATRSEATAVLPVWRARTRLADWPVEIIGMVPHETYSAHFTLLDAAPDVWRALHEENAVLISEQLARRLNVGLGGSLDIPTSRDNWRAKIVGIFPDYGNPRGQLRLDHARVARLFPDVPGVHYALRVAAGDVPRLMEDMQTRFGPKIARLIDNAEIKKISKDIFERTFTVTAALNTLTLIVSAIALFAGLLTLSNLRIAHIAPVWAMGVTRRRLAGLELLRILLFSAGVALVAIPLGLFMTWGLVAIVNVVAFGWRLPMHVFPAHWAQVFVIALVTALFASVVPALRLARSAPADLLKVFANER
ncbi:ABC transporter permease [Methylocystis parvus]|uniref:ABC transporter permease n=1 Tax=Methylocystis parvus TaxID=134 RepID=A0A6B8LYP2_9HYPH|nr:ABC transporter permease [Methylocystis parvus]QGM96584.1 ABC transporter permease [Methylocystis parvus]WBJ99562.1 ABC transporter permease [Methylocystis parvus OBBP]